MDATQELLVALTRLMDSVKAALADRKLTLTEAYEILREFVQDAVGLADVLTALSGEQKRDLVTKVAIQVAEAVIAKLTLPPVVSLILRPAIRAAVPVLVDLLLELWVARLRTKP